MATYTYEQIYSDPKKAVIRSSSDAAIVGLRNGQEVSVVCDRKWGEFTPADDSVSKPLTFKSLQNGSSVTLCKSGSAYGDFETSTDGLTWTHYTLGTAIILNAGDRVMFRSSSDIEPRQESSSKRLAFVATGRIEAWNNIMSLYRKTDFATYSYVGQCAFYGLFWSMRDTLIKAPLLPATTLSADCYAFMFQGCTSLQKAPLLPATASTSYCYTSMFNACSSLNEVRCYLQSRDYYATIGWLNGVSPTGTFYKSTGASWPSGADGIPSGWTVVEVAPEGEVLARLSSTTISHGEVTFLTINESFVLYDPTKTYTVLHLYGSDGVTPVGSEQSYVRYSSMGAFNTSYPDRLCLKQVYGRLTGAHYVKYRVERAQS